MVIDQGTMLDRIDYNVENVNVNVKGAEKELKIVCRASCPFTYLFLIPDWSYNKNRS